MNVNVCTGSCGVPLSLLRAVMVTERTPPEPTVGVPLIVAVPSWLSCRVRPPGKLSAEKTLGIGQPMAVTVKLSNTPRVNVFALPLVMVGAANCGMSSMPAC